MHKSKAKDWLLKTLSEQHDQIPCLLTQDVFTHNAGINPTGLLWFIISIWINLSEFEFSACLFLMDLCSLWYIGRAPAGIKRSIFHQGDSIQGLGVVYPILLPKDLIVLYRLAVAIGPDELCCRCLLPLMNCRHSPLDKANFSWFPRFRNKSL